MLETIIIRRFDQLSPDEITTCASGFSVSGFGSPYFIKLMEQSVMTNMGKFSNTSLKEIARGFVFCLRGSKLLLQMLLPRFTTMLPEFSCNELCYMLFAYHEAGYVPKTFAAEVE